MTFFKKSVLFLMMLVPHTGLLFAAGHTKIQLTKQEQTAITYLNFYGSWQKLDGIKNQLNCFKKLTIDEAQLPELKTEADQRQIEALKRQVDTLTTDQLVQYGLDVNSQFHPYMRKFVYERARSTEIQEWFDKIEKFNARVQRVLLRAISNNDKECVNQVVKLVNPNIPVPRMIPDGVVLVDLEKGVRRNMVEVSDRLSVRILLNCEDCAYKDDDIKIAMMTSLFNAGLDPASQSWLLAQYNSVRNTGVSLTVAEFLLRQGVPVNKKDGIGITPLMKAARQGLKEHVKLLLLRGADKTVTYLDKTAADMARDDGQNYIADFIKNFSTEAPDAIDVITEASENHTDVSPVVEQQLVTEGKNAFAVDVLPVIDLSQAAEGEGEKSNERPLMPASANQDSVSLVVEQLVTEEKNAFAAEVPPVIDSLQAAGESSVVVQKEIQAPTVAAPITAPEKKLFVLKPFYNRFIGAYMVRDTAQDGSESKKIKINLCNIVEEKEREL